MKIRRSVHLGLVGTAVAVLTLTSVAVVLEAETGARPASALSLGGMSIQPSAAPAFDLDAPDPDVVASGSAYYAFTTGTALGNHLQALVDTSGSPGSGWTSYNGLSYGSSALPVVPAWEQADTQTSPGVLNWGGHWLLYYDASQAGHAAGTGYDCLSVATASTPDPDGPGLHRPLDPASAVPAGSGGIHRSRVPSWTR